MVAWTNINFISKGNKDIWLSEENWSRFKWTCKSYIIKFTLTSYKWIISIRLLFDHLHTKYSTICSIHSCKSYPMIWGEKLKILWLKNIFPPWISSMVAYIFWELNIYYITSKLHIKRPLLGRIPIFVN